MDTGPLWLLCISIRVMQKSHSVPSHLSLCQVSLRFSRILLRRSSWLFLIWINVIFFFYLSTYCVIPRSYINIIINTLVSDFMLKCNFVSKKQPFIDPSVPTVFTGHITAYLSCHDLLIFSNRTLPVAFWTCCWTMSAASLSICYLVGWWKMKLPLRVPFSRQLFKQCKNHSCDWSICLLFLLF